MNEDNKIFKTNEISIEISPVKNTVDSQRAQYYSYDENSGLQRIHILKDGQPLGLSEGSQVRLSAVKLSGSKQMMIYTPEIEDRVNSIVTFVIPKEFLGYSGQIRCTLYIDFSSDQTLHAGYFYINMGISDIDANLPEFSDSYWQRWTDFESEATTKMKELEAALDGEAQRLTEHANQKIAEYDQKFQQTEQNIATLDQNLTELRENMKLSEAWAWSKDGTDRFTTEYPGENLWLGRREYYWESATTGWYEYVGIKPTDNGIKITGAKFVTSSFWVKTTEKLSSRVNVQVIFLKDNVKKYSYNIYVPTSDAISGAMVKRTIDISNIDTNQVNIAMFIPTGIVGEEFRISDIKIELGENLDPVYTSPPSEDPLNAYPKYKGLRLAPSDNPADYDWSYTDEYVDYLKNSSVSKTEFNDLAARLAALENKEV